MTKITLLSLLLLAGCGGGARLTCEYLEDPENCWAQAAAAAKACLPAVADSGVLAADLVYFMIISVSTPGELFRCTPTP
jgi:hypothetical protein